jgi:hypothetical protein
MLHRHRATRCCHIAITFIVIPVSALTVLSSSPLLCCVRHACRIIVVVLVVVSPSCSCPLCLSSSCSCLWCSYSSDHPCCPCISSYFSHRPHRIGVLSSPCRCIVLVLLSSSYCLRCVIVSSLPHRLTNPHHRHGLAEISCRSGESRSYVRALRVSGVAKMKRCAKGGVGACVWWMYCIRTHEGGESAWEMNTTYRTNTW